MPSLPVRRHYIKVGLLCVISCSCFVSICLISYSNIGCQQYDELKKTYFNYNHNRKLNPHNVTLDIPSPDLCQQKPEPYLFIMIPSATDNFEKRNTIRNTWKHYGDNDKLQQNGFGKSVVIAFILGRTKLTEVSEQVLRELEKHSDIVQGNFTDVYDNLLTKVLTGFNCKIQYCPSAKYLVKADDDVYLDIPNLIRYLEHQDDIYSNPRVTPVPDRIYGWVFRGSLVQRTGKYAIACKDYPFREFGDYAAGSIYIISSDLVSKLLELSEYLPKIRLEDIHLTGTLRYLLGAHLIHRYEFSLGYLGPMKQSPCYFHSNNMIAKTNVDVKTMHLLWSMHLKKRNVVRLTLNVLYMAAICMCISGLY